MKRSLVIILSCSTAMLAACGSNKDSGSQSGSSNISSVTQDSQLNSSDLQMLANADVDDAQAEIAGSPGSAASLQSAMNNVGDLASAVLGLSSCSTSAASGPINAPVSTLTVNCPSVTGTVVDTSTLGFPSSSSDVVVNLTIAGATDHATIDRETKTSSMFLSSASATRTVQDSYVVGGNTFNVAGSSSISSSLFGGNITASATYSVQKNSGAIDTVTVTSSADLHYSYNCGLDAGSITYTSSSATYTETFSACLPSPVPNIPNLPTL